jgi:biotin carboxyl carrier protein
MSNTIKDIIHLYDEILDLKKTINESLLNEGMVKLSTTSYSNVKYDDDCSKNDFVNQGLLDDIQTAAKSAGIIATITTTKCDHDPQTTSGSDSRHMFGTAVDVAILDGIGSNYATNSRDGNPHFRELGFKLKDKLVSLGYTWNQESGQNKDVLWQTNIGGNHYNHLHISNRIGASNLDVSVDNNSNSSSSNNSNSSSSNNSNSYSSNNSSNQSQSGGDSIIKNVAMSIGKSFGLAEEMNKTKKSINEGSLNAPIPNIYVTSPFWAKRSYENHPGVDLRATSGTEVRSPADGTVIRAEYTKGNCGGCIQIQHGSRYKSRYCHIKDIRVNKGQSVKQGDVIFLRDNLINPKLSVYVYHNLGLHNSVLILEENESKFVVHSIPKRN